MKDIFANVVGLLVLFSILPLGFGAEKPRDVVPFLEAENPYTRAGALHELVETKFRPSSKTAGVLIQLAATGPKQATQKFRADALKLASRSKSKGTETDCVALAGLMDQLQPLEVQRPAWVANASLRCPTTPLSIIQIHGFSPKIRDAQYQSLAIQGKGVGAAARKAIANGRDVHDWTMVLSALPTRQGGYSVSELKDAVAAKRVNETNVVFAQAAVDKIGRKASGVKHYIALMDRKPVVQYLEVLAELGPKASKAAPKLCTLLNGRDDDPVLPVMVKIGKASVDCLGKESQKGRLSPVYAEALGQLGGAGHKELKRRFDEADAYSAPIALWGIGAAARPPAWAMESALAHTDHPDNRYRTAAIQVLSKFKRNKKALTRLRELADGDDWVSQKAAEALGQGGLQGDVSSALKLELAKIGATGKSNRKTRELRKLCNDEDASIRALAIAALARTSKSSSTIKLVTQKLKDEDPDVAYQAAKELGGFGKRAKSAVRALNEVTNDPYFGHIALLSLAKIRGPSRALAEKIRRAQRTRLTPFNMGTLDHALYLAAPQERDQVLESLRSQALPAHVNVLWTMLEIGTLEDRLMAGAMLQSGYNYIAKKY